MDDDSESSSNDEHQLENFHKKRKTNETDITGTTNINWKEIKRKRKEEREQRREMKLLKQFEKQKRKESEEELKKTQGEEEEKIKQKIGRNYTVSIALPGFILDNAQSLELRTYLAGQIARAAVIFNVDEIVVFDETGSLTSNEDGEFHSVKKSGQANVQLARILQYLECPQYLRKSFFPQHQDLQYAGVLNPLDSPHHMRADDPSVYREGIVLQKPTKPGKGSFVNVGTLKEVQVDKHLQPGLRVTVKLKQQTEKKKITKGTVVSPCAPRTDAGIYWGYTIRLARSLGAVFTESPYTGGYDTTIGTSERGQNVDTFTMPKFSHLLIVFGGVKGLEASLDADEALDVGDPTFLFHHYLNTCPNQGSRTIRTEEAILITLTMLRPHIEKSKTTPIS